MLRRLRQGQTMTHLDEEDRKMGLFGGGAPAAPAPVPTVAPTKAPSMADPAVQDAYGAAKKRFSASGTKTTILTSGRGASGTPSTGGKTLLGQ